MSQTTLARGNFRRSWILWVLGLAVASFLGCAQATPTPIPTPTPTPIPTPTPTPLPTSPGGLGIAGGLDAGLDPVELSSLLVLVPGRYGMASYVNVAVLSQEPALRQSLQLEQMGPAGVLLPLIADRVSTVVIAGDAAESSSVAVFYGSMDVEGLLQLASSMGTTMSESPQEYGPYLIWTGNVYGLVGLGLTEAAEHTTVVAQAPMEAGQTRPLELVREALDLGQHQEDSFAGQRAISEIISSAPLGLVTLLYADCDLLTDLLPAARWSGCVAGSIGLRNITEDSLVLHLTWAFDTATQAGSAQTQVAAKGMVLAGVELEEITTRLEGTVLHLEASGTTEPVLAAVAAELQQ